jgi:hypothetical protein
MTLTSEQFTMVYDRADFVDGGKTVSLTFRGGDDAISVIVAAMDVLQKETANIGPIIEGRAYLISDDKFLAERIRSMLLGRPPVPSQEMYLHFITRSLEKLETSLSRLQAAVDKMSTEGGQ